MSWKVKYQKFRSDPDPVFFRHRCNDSTNHDSEAKCLDSDPCFFVGPVYSAAAAKKMRLTLPLVKLKMPAALSPSTSQLLIFSTSSLVPLQPFNGLTI
jgi:hypothetical protein